MEVSAPSTNSVDSTNLFAFNSNYSAFASSPGSGGQSGEGQPEAIPVDLSQFSTQILLNMQAAASGANSGVDTNGNVRNSLYFY